MERYFKGEWDNFEKNYFNVREFLSFSKPIRLYDIGSGGGAPPPFSWIVEGINLVNLEPDQRTESQPGGETLPVAIGPKNLTKIYLTNRWTLSSLLQPNEKTISRYAKEPKSPTSGSLIEKFEIQAIYDVETYGLDEIIELRNLPQPDFLKVDAQGLTFEVLESTAQSLSNSIIGLQVELEFIELYKSQKLFGEVNQYLYERGFEIFKFTKIAHWPYHTELSLKIHRGQPTYCDVVYFRRIESLEENRNFWTQEKLTKTILICLLYDLTDVSAAILEKAKRIQIIGDKEAKRLEELIIKWPGALRFFFKTKSSIRIWDQILDVSLRKVWNFLMNGLAGKFKEVICTEKVRFTGGQR